MTGTWIGSAIVDKISKQGLIGHVSAIFNQSFHVLTPNNHLLCFVSEKLYPGPLNVTVQFPKTSTIQKSGLMPEQPVERINDSLVIGKGVLTISLSQSKIWSSPTLFKKKMLPANEIQSNINVLRNLLTKSKVNYPMLFDHLHDGIENHNIQNPTSISPETIVRLKQLLQAIIHKNLPAISTTVDGLIGIGRGLTPTMDDILVGIITGLTYFTNNLYQNRRYIAKVNNAIKSSSRKTTLLSQELINAATTAEIGKPIYELVKVLLTSTLEEITTASAKVFAIGGTSGIEIAFGLVLGLESSLTISKY